MKTESVAVFQDAAFAHVGQKLIDFFRLVGGDSATDDESGGIIPFDDLSGTFSNTECILSHWEVRCSARW